MPTHFSGSAADVRALNLLIKLMRASMTVKTQLSRAVTGHGLTEPQFGVLETLYFLGPLSPSALSHKRLSSGANITTVLDNLEKRELVRREQSEEDRRCSRVQLTPEGRRLIARIFPGHVAAARELFSVLTAAEQETLAELSRKLGVGIVERASRAPKAPRRAAQSAGRK